MKIRLVWVGKTKERFIQEGIEKYLRLLRPFADVAVSEIREEKGKDIQRMVEKEGERILKLRSPYVLLDEKGREYTSAGFADFLSGRQPYVHFVVGGAYGVSERVKEAAEGTVALSEMTLTHEMSRLLLVEQLYRAFTIMHKRGYHH
ncbi:MAG: 23S rRNA (pseudouridine(1915)-N(3))-methyltransferase RlmH [Acidobacteriota bacterium]